MSLTKIASLLLIVLLVPVRSIYAHCEVPCGIYGDQARFERMLENTETIGKAIAQVNELSKSHSPTNVNQAVRWVNTKEEHATDTQHIIAQYFMTQRIKADDPQYTAKLTAAHKVMVAAMKCKQDAAPATAEALRSAILDFYRAYEGREPDFVAHN